MEEHVRILGTLIEQEELEIITAKEYLKPVYKVSTGDYMFIVKPISETPNNLMQVKTFNVYDNQMGGAIAPIIAKYAATDLDKVEEWFSKRCVIFTPRESGTGYYNVANDVQIIDLPATHDDKTKYVPVPFYDLKSLKLSLDEFESKLFNNEWINCYPGVSHNSDDTFPLILCSCNNVYYVYGNVIGAEHNFNGTKLKFEDNIVKRCELDFNDGYQIISDGEFQVEFFPNELVAKYENNLYPIEDKGIKREIPLKIEEPREISLSEPEKIINRETIVEDRNAISEVSGEDEFLHQFYNVVKNDGMLYDEADLVNFHVAMKSSNLVILSGMSGTGKSRLVRLYAKALGNNSQAVNTLKMVPVKPSWTDDSDLLGYLDTINMIYRPSDTGIIDVLVNASKNPEGINIICLDEMNLSRVEHYFSQFLSALEANENERIIRLYNPNIENRVYNAFEYPAEVPIGKNVIFVGTVNVDESTYHFSDKVLDRANVIKLHSRNFTELKALLSEEKKELSVKTITMKTFSEFMHKENNAALSLNDDEVNLLNEINVAMIDNLQNSAIGYRIIRQIDVYLKNLPKSTYYPRSKAFDYLLVQRVFTKLRGSEEQLRKLVGKVGEDGLVADSAILDILQKYSQVSDFNESRKIITNKAKELVTYGYTI